MTAHNPTAESLGDGLRAPDGHRVAPASDPRPSLTTWVDRADELDEFALVLALQRIQTEPSAEISARALLSLGDPQRAYRALAAEEAHPLPAPGASFTNRDMLVAACRASMGDDDADRWLLHSAALMMEHPSGWFAAHLVALASDLRGETDVADRAWRVLAEKFGVTTPHVVGRLVAGHVARRRDKDGPAVIRRLADASTSLENATHPIAVDPRPTLAAVTALVERDDTAGARLLLEFVTRRNEAVPALTARLRSITPHREMRQYQWLVIAGFTLVPLVFLLGGVGLVAVLAGAWLVRTHLHVPGFSMPESQAWRAARALRIDPRTGMVTEGRPDGAWIALAMLAGGVLGTAVGALLMPRVASLGDWATVSAWLGPLVLSVVLAHQAASRWSRSRQRSLIVTTRTEAMRAQVASLGSCRCWDTTILTDGMARAYAQRHLVSAGLDPVATPLGQALGRPAGLLRCPSLGTLWLLADLTVEGAALLLRGSIDDAGSTGRSDVGQYL